MEYPDTRKKYQRIDDAIAQQVTANLSWTLLRMRLRRLSLEEVKRLWAEANGVDELLEEQENDA